MRRPVVTTLLCSLLLLAGPTPSREPAAANEEGDAAFHRRVGEAIDAGVAYLKAAQRRDGTWPVTRGVNRNSTAGEQALILLTLAKCGVPERDEVMQRGLRVLKPNLVTVLTKPQGGYRFFTTYALACTILLYDTLYRREKRGRVSYPPKVKKEVQKIVDFLVEHQAANGGFRYPTLPEEAERRSIPIADMSVTQYALLGINVATRAGVKVPKETFQRALEFVLSAQEPDGPPVEFQVDNPNFEEGGRYGPPTIPVPGAQARGWGYANLRRVYGSMTVGGISSLAILKERLRAAGALSRESTRRIDDAILDGLGWMSANYDVTRNPQHRDWHYYYLYGLERAGSLLGMRHVGEHDWYREGAEVLLREQLRGEGDAEGRWPAIPKDGGGVVPYQDSVIQSCFALLFLKRGTEPPSEPVRPAVTTEGD